MPLREESEILFANDAFYAAFVGGDIDAMDELWAREHPVSCIHPGGPVLIGRVVVLDSWYAILSSGQTPPITQRDVTAMLAGDMGWVTCLECVGDTVVAATNIFVRENGVWKMTHHQAGLTSALPEEEDTPPIRAN